MTEKRFLLKWLEYEPYYIDTKQEYVDTNDYLEIDEYPTMSDEQVVECLNKFFEEREQLFNFKENVFNLIDEKIKRGKQAIEWGESVEADVGSMGFHIALLKQLKKELLEMIENKRFEVWEQEPTKETTKSFVCTKKRFVFAHDNVGLNLKTPIMDGDKKMNIGEVLDKMNNLYEENEQLETKNNAYLQDIEAFKEENTALKLDNEQLKQAYIRLKHRHSLLHDVCIDAECDRDSYRKDVASLEKENEQLKKRLIKLKEENAELKEENEILWCDDNDCNSTS